MGKCAIAGCEKVARNRGMCPMHYRRWLLYGNANTVHVGHGMSRTKEYSAWGDMKQRCYNQKCANYKYYGARGVRVCNSWYDSFETFYKDMGPLPFKGAVIDRIDYTGDYEPDNCRWVNRSINSRNKRNVILCREDVFNIHRKKKSGLSNKEIAGEFCVDPSHISRILSGKKWKDIYEELRA